MLSIVPVVHDEIKASKASLNNDLMIFRAKIRQINY